MQNNICPDCKAHLEEDFSFCPYCGTAITSLAKEYEGNKIRKSQIQAVYALSKKITDKESLITIKQFVEFLGK